MSEDSGDVMNMLVGLGFCLAMVALLIVGIWLAVRRKQPAAASAVVPVAGPTMHVSVLALSFDAELRSQVDEALEHDRSGTGQDERLKLVRQVVAVLLPLELAWRDFGYGEKELVDLEATKRSYHAALDDFSRRADLESDGGNLAVVTLILATRGALQGVSRLDQRIQARGALESRAQLAAADLLGAEVLWAPTKGHLSTEALRQHFPEMHLLVD